MNKRIAKWRRKCFEFHFPNDEYNAIKAIIHKVTHEAENFADFYLALNGGYTIYDDYSNGSLMLMSCDMDIITEDGLTENVVLDIYIWWTEPKVAKIMRVDFLMVMSKKDDYAKYICTIDPDSLEIIDNKRTNWMN